MIKQLKPYLAKYRLPSILAPLTVIVEVLLEIQIPFLMSKIVDQGITTRDLNYVFQIGAIMVLVALCSLLFGVLSGRFAAKGAMGFGSELRKAVFDKIQEFSFANIDRFSTPSLVTRLTTDITNTQMAYMMVIRVLVRAPVMLVSATIMAAAINGDLVRVFLIVIPILAIALATMSTLAFPRFNAMLKKYDGLNAQVQENLIAIRVVKAFVRARYEKKKFAEANDSLMQASLAAEKIIILGMPIMMLTMYATIIAILWFGGNMIIGGTLLTGELISFISYVTQILMSLMMIAQVFIMIVLSRSSVSRIIEVLEEPISITDETAAPSLTADDGSIEYRNVSFKYQEDAAENILTGIDFSIASGETVGIIGGTGSAKTTLVQLIPRLYDVTDGQVLVGGHDVRDYTLDHLRSVVAMVLQKNVLFSGTIKDNLKWGDENATDEEVIAAAKAACAHDFIMSFPEGYDTYLGQGGVNVSGGQKQRLCIARALLKKPKIIILDDSTSAVDTATDAAIREGFRQNLKDTTAIIIAQRISSVSDADKIIVLDEGRIDAIDTHENLLENNAIYREVFHSQQKGVEE
ncbi:ATP-binding cassette, subfamily B [Eubacterium maltosivorans]|uniref:ABC transporter ATP-binding protein n=1 Tax=Eubacterium maltosivorans TaxID=2041044 RepID=UPI0008849DB4|nr:ABC transporter ATP-binding protein [Eubacterium maltosivorans]WPK82326.1 putative ABC transporter ATP-binding protein [Eubacterium maltosivorans]SDO52370.1 ATP-binding cassette, subfamily B [Eubacterium maltosivorans]